MAITVIVPAESIISSEEIRAFIPSVRDADVDYVELLATVAQAAIEPPNGWLGCAFGTQTLQLIAGSWSEIADCDQVVALPFPPQIAVESIKYINEAGTVITMAPSEYQSIAPFGVMPASGTYWPVTAARPDAIKIQFTAGYATDDPALLPAKQAIALSVQALRTVAREDLFLKRDKVEGIGEKEWAVSAQAERIVRDTVDRLLMPYRRSWM